MNAQDLKNSILQLAVQGKLVEQRPEEGTAKELLVQIKAEKEQLIKDKKIKKEKVEEVLSEVPFEIPDTWIWTRLGDIFYNKSGLSYKKGDLDIITDGMVRVFRGGNILELEYKLKDDDVMISRQFVKDDLFLKKNMLITPAVTSLEHIGKMARIEKDLDDTVVGGFVLMLIPYVSNDILSEYLLYALSSHYHRSQCRKITNKSGQAFYNLSREKLMNFYLPIPPLKEQERIVSKIEEILPYIEQYDKAYTKLEAFNKKFPEDMKKSILQMAMQGKLVEQRPEEGTADELYEQIVAEKERLIKDGKIKKEKPLAEISEDEIPFDIPESWKWVRIGDIFSLQAGKNISATDIFEMTTDGYKYPCFGGNGVRGYVKKCNKSGNYALIGRQGALCGNINIAEGDFYATEHAVVVDHFECTDVKWGAYFLKALNLNQYATATAQPGLAVGNIIKVLIPLPPLEEQKRIVAKLEQMLPYCEQLIK